VSYRIAEKGPYMSGEFFHISGLEHWYAGRKVLSLNQLNLGAGRILGLVGPNGSGKSTLLRIMALLETPSRGSIRFLGHDASKPGRELRRQVSLLLQEPYLLKRSVFNNVAYGLRMRGREGQLTEPVHEALNWVGLDPAEFAQRPWYRLSGGEAQRVSLAARLTLRPKLLLMDEPTASLDDSSTALIRDAALMAQKSWGASLVIASHDHAWLHEVSDQVLYLNQGRPASPIPVNLLPGEWSPGGEGLWTSQIAGGQIILAPPPPKGMDPAAIPGVAPMDISLHNSIPIKEPGQNLLEGVVKQIGLEPFSGDCLVQIKAGGLNLSVRMDVAGASCLAIYPGQEVWLLFSVESVSWG
jgi:tungstate transport system ATP-binding protein